MYPNQSNRFGLTSFVFVVMLASFAQNLYAQRLPGTQDRQTLRQDMRDVARRAMALYEPF